MDDWRDARPATGRQVLEMIGLQALMQIVLTALATWLLGWW